MKRLPSPATASIALLVLSLLPPAAKAEKANDTPVNRLLGDSTQWLVGASAIASPRYAGSNETHFQVLPAFSVQRGILFADTTRGAGLQYQTNWGLYISESIYYDFGRVDYDDAWRPGSDRLKGMGDVHGSATLHTLIAQQFSSWFTASIEADSDLKSGASRNHMRAGAEFTVLKSGRDKVAVDMDTWWGDQHYNEAYFGVTPTQSAHSSFAPFSPSGGLYAYSTGVEWDHTFTPHWATTLQLVGTRYIDNAHGSPIVTRHMTFNTVAALTYSF